MYSHGSFNSSFFLKITLINGDKIPSSQCIERGFSANLLCSSCKPLGEFQLDFLSDKCKQCCQQDAEDEQQTVMYKCFSYLNFIDVLPKLSLDLFVCKIRSMWMKIGKVSTNPSFRQE